MNLLDKYGEWAVITGASSGIGREFANRLAEEGLNLFLIARRKIQLELLADELKQKYGAEVIAVELDLTKENILDALSKFTDGKEIGVLINNAGVGSPGEFIDADPEHEIKMVTLNCAAPVILTHHFIKEMKERKKGAIVFLGSTAAFQPTPFMSTYSATKAFNLYLGYSLWWEFKKYNIDVLALNPGGTETEFKRLTGNKTNSVLRTTKQVVNTAMKSLGKKPGVIDGLINKTMCAVLNVVSKKFAVKITGFAASRIYTDR